MVIDHCLRSIRSRAVEIDNRMSMVIDHCLRSIRSHTPIMEDMG